MGRSDALWFALGQHSALEARRSPMRVNICLHSMIYTTSSPERVGFVYALLDFVRYASVESGRSQTWWMRCSGTYGTGVRSSHTCGKDLVCLKRGKG